MPVLPLLYPIQDLARFVVAMGVRIELHNLCKVCLVFIYGGKLVLVNQFPYHIPWHAGCFFLVERQNHIILLIFPKHISEIHFFLPIGCHILQNIFVDVVVLEAAFFQLG